MPSALVAVHGESGIGKTRMVAELAQRVRRRGGRVLWGSCYEGGGASPFGPWAEGLGGLAGLPPAELRALLGADAAVVAELVPALRDVIDVGTEPAAPLSADEGRIRLYEAVVRLLEAFEGPTLVVLDDAQWADPATLDLLVHVARFSPRTAVVVTYAGATLDLDDPLAVKLAEVRRQRPVDYLPLTSLRRDDAEALLERAAGRRLEPPLVDAIYAESGGNPFFLSELGRHLRRQGVDVHGGRSWTVPPTVLGAVALRYAPLGAETRRMLELASALSSSFTFAELRELVGAGEEALLDGIEEALGAELLRPAGEERYDFSHAIVRNALRARYSSSRRARLHRRVAEALERAHPDDSRPVAAEIARQYHASATLPGRERGVAFAFLAAERARAAHAPSDAVEILRMALDLVDPGDAATRGRVLGALALVQAEALQLEEALTTLDEALTLLERDGVEGVEIAQLVYEVCSALVESTSISLGPVIARGLEALGETDSLAAARLRLLERALVAEERPVRWLNLDADAVDTLRALGTEADFARTIDPTEAWAVDMPERLLDTVERWHDPAARLRALQALVLRTAVLRTDRPAVAERAIADLRALAEAHGSPVGRLWTCLGRGALLGERGDLDGASAELAHARELTRGWSRLSWVPPFAALVEGLTTRHTAPDWPAMARTFRELSEEPRQYRWDRMVHAAFAALAYARSGEAERARSLLGQIAPEFDETDPVAYHVGHLLELAGAAVVELADAELAAQLRPLAERVVATGVADSYMASSELALARVLSVLGEVDEALARFGHARAALELRGRRPLRAIADHDEAVARRRHGRPGADPLMAAAAARFDELGMREWARRAEAARPDLPDGLTPREAEILRYLAAGRTNKQIAAELVISVHTVERHIQNAYRKVGASNRAEATAYAIRALLRG